MYDLIIQGGSYPDFRRKQMLQGDIAVKNGRIAAIGAIREPAKQVIQAEGRVVSPGFLDIHMHEEDFSKEGECFQIAERMLKMGVTTCVGGNCGTQHQSVAQFRTVLDRLGGAPVNYLLQAGYNTARQALGLTHYETASPEQIETLIAQMQQELDSGAIGISFGLEYDPGISTEEVLQVVQALHHPDLFVSMHYREDSVGAEASIREMIAIAEAIAPNRFQISHLSSCSAMGQMAPSLALINEAMARLPGLDYDTYPYSAFSTGIGTAVFDDGCFEHWGKDYSSILLTDGPHKGEFCTKELFEQVRREDPEQYVVAMVMNEDEIAAALTNPTGMVASDGIISNGHGHPRAAGTFPRVLGKYVREEGKLSLLEALRKMTLAPADRLRLFHKGRIEVGCDADLTVFDPTTIQDGATFTDLDVPVTGIDLVVVNGHIALERGSMICGRAGRFLTLPERT